MPKYAARTTVHYPVRGKTDDGDMVVVGYRAEEVMFDKMLAGSLADAAQRAREESVSYQDDVWMTVKSDIDVPPPRVLACSRIDEDGVPVTPDFPLPAIATRRVMPPNKEEESKPMKKLSKKDRAIIRNRRMLIEAKRRQEEAKDKAPPPPPIFKLPDPFTEELITSISLSNK